MAARAGEGQFCSNQVQLKFGKYFLHTLNIFSSLRYTMLFLAVLTVTLASALAQETAPADWEPTG